MKIRGDRGKWSTLEFLESIIWTYLPVSLIRMRIKEEGVSLEYCGLEISVLKLFKSVFGGHRKFSLVSRGYLKHGVYHYGFHDGT